MRFNWSIISDKIYGILKGSCKTISMYDAKGNETIDPNDATRFFASFESSSEELEDFTILVAMYDEGQKSHINIKTPKLSTDEDFEVVNNIRTHIRKSIGEREGIKINWQVFDHAIDPREEAVNNIKESKKITELSKDKLKNYADKAVDSLDSEAQKYGVYKKDEYPGDRRKSANRKKGLKMAIKKMEEDLSESKDMSKVYGSTKSSYQTIGNAKLIVRHSDRINEEKHGARSRKLRALFVENKNGERFAYPHLHMAGARAFARHISNGGTNHDNISTKLFSISEDYMRLRRSGAQLRAKEGVDPIWITAIKEGMGKINRKLKSMHGPKGYVDMSTSLLEDNIVEDTFAVEDVYKKISEMFSKDEAESLSEDFKTAAKYIVSKQNEPAPLNFVWNRTPDLTSKLNEFTKASDRFKWQLTELASACGDVNTSARLASIARLLNDGIMPTEQDLDIMRQAYTSGQAHVIEEKQIDEEVELNEFLDQFTIEATLAPVDEVVIETENDLILMRKVDDTASGKKVEVFRNADKTRFKIKHYVDGVYQQGCDYDGTDPDETFEQAGAFLRGEKALTVKHVGEMDSEMGDDGILEDKRNGGKPFDYYTFNLKGGKWHAYGWGTYPESSVLAGQARKVWLDAFDTEEEARAAYPDAEISSKFTEPQINLSHLPGDDDVDPYGDNEQAHNDMKDDYYESGHPDDEIEHPDDIEDEYPDDDEDFGDYDDMDSDNYRRRRFADPGGDSALHAADEDNPRDQPCPTCNHPNRLTPADVAAGYQCDKCARATETGREIDYYEGPETADQNSDGDHAIDTGRIDMSKLDMYEEVKRLSKLAGL